MPDVLMPRLSDTMAEGVLSQWLKQPGDEVHRGDVLAEIETDKATMELESYDDGVLERVLVEPGATVPIGTPIAVIGDGSGGSGDGAEGAAATAGTTSRESTGQAAEPAAREQAQPEPPAQAPQPARVEQPAPAQQPARPRPGPAATADTAAGPGGSAGRIRTSPLARAIARDHGIDLATVTGTGPGGRIVRADVEAAVAAGGAQAAPARPPLQGPDRPAAPPPATAPVATPERAGDDVDEVPLSAVRRVTARRLSEGATVPQFSLTSAVDVDRLLAFRAEINERLAPDGPKVTVTDLLVRACAVTLRRHPSVNASWGGDRILRHRRVHVGVAVALEDGLIVPVVKDADRLSVGEIAVATRSLAERARSGQLTPEEFTGGTFTISNLGMYGVEHFTAVLNPPEAGILAVGAAAPEAVVRDGEVVVRSTMRLTLSVDHRVADGATAAAFLRELSATLAEPLRIVV